MERLKGFDRALLGKQIGGNSLIVIIDTIYFVSGVFFGRMHLDSLLRYVLFINMLVTCTLYKNFIVSRGEMRYELNTEKIVYYPTTRFQYLWNKYAKTLFFLCIQLSITLLCLVLGYYGNMGHMEGERILGSLAVVTIGILLTSGIAILVMHIMPLGVYLAMLLFLPLFYGMSYFKNVLAGEADLLVSPSVAVLTLVGIIVLVWLMLLPIGVKIYEKVT